MTPKKYFLIKAITNVISGLSMSTLIILGIAYMSFDNAFVFQDVKIEIVNNPIKKHDDINFIMIGSKKHECASTQVYGVAYSDDGHMHRLDKFTKQYTRNTRPGEPIPNQWSMAVPDDMIVGGEYRVSMTGDFICNYLIFQSEKSQTYDNILLIVEPQH
jgi:hypothetical protein